MAAADTHTHSSAKMKSESFAPTNRVHSGVEKRQNVVSFITLLGRSVAAVVLWFDVRWHFSVRIENENEMEIMKVFLSHVHRVEKRLAHVQIDARTFFF